MLITRRRSKLVLVCDVFRQHSFAFAPRYAAKYLSDGPPVSVYTFRSAAFGGPLIVMHRLDLYTPTDISLATRMVTEYKAMRSLFWQVGRCVSLRCALFLPSPRNYGAVVSRLSVLRCFISSLEP